MCCALAAALSCQPKLNPDTPDPEPEEINPADVDDPVDSDKYGRAYIFDKVVLPEVHVTVPLEEWNQLLAYYDDNPDTKKYVHCDVEFVRRGESTKISDAAIRLRGNGSRRRPEGSTGEMHTKDKTNWHHFHFGLNFRKYNKDDDHELHGARKINLKWCCTDRSYVREVYSYDLFRRAGVWSTSRSVHARVWFKVEGDSKEAYYGIYQMYEPVDEQFLKFRKSDFEATDGNLWKCRVGAFLNTMNDDYGNDEEESDIEHRYELKTNNKKYDQAYAQMSDFVTKLNSLDGQAFIDWISSHCDVKHLIRTYAVNVALGQWDDYWCNGNNYYLYFNSTDPHDYKVYFIPYDYDNALGTCKTKGKNNDAAMYDPMKWGQDKAPLIRKILKDEGYKQLYKDELLRLANPVNKLLDYSASIQRVLAWQGRIENYVNNDTNEDTKIQDLPASYSTHDYKLLGSDPAKNFFMLKTAAIQKYCQ